MKQFEKRIRVLEKAAGQAPGQADDNSLGARIARAHARGEIIRRITVDPGEGETIESVCERGGITDDMCCIVNMLVYPTGGEATEEKLETAGEASPAIQQRVSRPHERSWMAK